MIQMEVLKTSTGTLFKNYLQHSCKLLEYRTSIFQKNIHKQVPTTGFFDANTSTFATYSMSNEFIQRMIYGSNYNSVDINIAPVYKGKEMAAINSKIELTDVQQPVMNSMLYNKNCEMFINLPTAVGKTVLAVHYISYYNRKCIILCHNKKVLEQWKNSLITKTDINPDRIKVINSSSYLNKVYQDDIDVNKIDIWLTTPAMISSYGETYGWNTVMGIFEKCGIGLKIIDEAHRNLATTIKLNAWTSIAKTIYLSADFNQASYEMRKQFFEVFRNVPVIKLDDETMQDLKHIIAVEYRFNTHPAIEEVIHITNENKRNKYHWNQYEYTKYQLEKGELANHVIRIVNQIVKSDKDFPNPNQFYKILILTNMIKVVDDMYSILLSTNIDRTIGRYHGQMTPEDQHDALNCDIIVATYQAFSEGTDVTSPNFRHVISTCPVDCILANQSAGRNRPIPGLNSYFWMLVDTGFEYCTSNSTKVLKYLSKSRVGTIKRIDEV